MSEPQPAQEEHLCERIATGLDELVASCVACDKTGETARWAAALRAEHKRFPALRDELDRALRAS